MTALQLATGHRQAANVTSGSLESAKPYIKDVKLALKKMDSFNSKNMRENSTRYSAALQQLIKAHSLRADRFFAFVGTQSITKLEVASCSSPCHLFPLCPEELQSPLWTAGVTTDILGCVFFWGVGTPSSAAGQSLRCAGAFCTILLVRPLSY